MTLGWQEGCALPQLYDIAGILLARRLVVDEEHDTRRRLFKRTARLFKWRVAAMLECSHPVQVG